MPAASLSNFRGRAPRSPALFLVALVVSPCVCRRRCCSFSAAPRFATSQALPYVSVLSTCLASRLSHRLVGLRSPNSLLVNKNRVKNSVSDIAAQSSSTCLIVTDSGLLKSRPAANPRLMPFSNTSSVVVFVFVFVVAVVAVLPDATDRRLDQRLLAHGLLGVYTHGVTHVLPQHTENRHVFHVQWQGSVADNSIVARCTLKD